MLRLAAHYAIVRDGALDHEAVITIANLAKVALIIVLHLLGVLELLRTQKALSDLLCIKVLDHVLELLGQLRVDLGLAEASQEVAVVGRLVDKTITKLLETDDLVQKQACVEIAVALPNWTRVHLAQYLAPLLHAYFLVFVQACFRQLVASLNFQHVQDEFFIQLFAEVDALRTSLRCN